MNNYRNLELKLINSQQKKDNYRILCNKKDDIPLFMQSWWMNAVCNNKDWDVLFYTKNDEIIAAFVFHYIEKMGFKIIIQPQLTQYNGLWINYSDIRSVSEKLSLEKEVMLNFIKQLSDIKLSYFDQSFQPAITNWLPFFWNGFSQTTRYTYQIKNISNIEQCYEQFSYAKKKQINKASRNLKIDFELSGESFYTELEQNLKYVKQNVFYSKDLFLRLYNECKSRNNGCIIAVRDNQMRIHAANFIVWDNKCSYNLISTINHEYRSSGASSLVIWEALKLMSTKTEIFDFEGSMNENIENSFRQFGTVQVPYFRIKKHSSLTFKILFNLKKWF